MFDRALFMAAGTQADLTVPVPQADVEAAVGRFRAACERSVSAVPRPPDDVTWLRDLFARDRDLDLAHVDVAAATHEARGEHEQAERLWRHAIALEPANAQRRLDLAGSLLRRGNYARGWAELERYRRQCWPQVAFGGRPPWDGGPLDGRTVLVRRDWGGLGDDLMLLRYIPRLAERAGRVVLVVRPSLARLTRANRLGAAEIRVGGAGRLGPAPSSLPRFDTHTWLPDLPLRFKTTPATIPAEPYLRPDPMLVVRWRATVTHAGPGLKVGLIWAASPWGQQQRNVPLAALAPLGRVPGVALVSLQKSVSDIPGRPLPADAGGEAEPAPDGLRLLRLGPSLGDLSDTAAAMACLDLIITVDTGPAHLAGALGRPTWLLLHEPADWRWALEREACPWYPSMRLFRQERSGGWGPVVAPVAGALARLVAGRRTA